MKAIMAILTCVALASLPFVYFIGHLGGFSAGFDYAITSSVCKP